MRPDSVNGAVPAKQQTLLEKIDSVDIKNTNQLSETLAGLRNDAEQEIKEAFADGKITDKESKHLSLLMSRFCSLSGQIKTAIRNASEELKNLYEQLSQNLTDTINRLTDASNGKNPDQALLEPSETDAKKPKAGPVDIKQWSKEDLVAEAGIIKSQFRPEGIMKRDYDSCFTHVFGSGAKIDSNDYGMIKGNLERFLSKYKKELQNNVLSFQKIDNSSRIETQISYYAELERREIEQNKKDYIEAKSGTRRLPSEKQAQAHGNAIQQEMNLQRKFENNNYNEWLNGS